MSTQAPQISRWKLGSTHAQMGEPPVSRAKAEADGWLISEFEAYIDGYKFGAYASQVASKLAR